MGMSASQARLIQLTARMSDLELEGQQINQQRLNLANQSSAIQEEALKMPIPTAPSTYDYMKDVYKGTDSDGNEVKAGSPDASGNMPISTKSKDPYNSMKVPENAGSDKAVKPETKEFDKLPEPNNTITATFKKEVEVHCWKGGDPETQISDDDYNAKTTDVSNKENTLKEKNNNKTTEPSTDDFKTLNQEAYNAAVNAWNATDENERGPEPEEQDYMTNVDDVLFKDAKAAYKDYNDAKTDLDSYQEDIYYDISDTETESVTSSKGGDVAANYTHAHDLNATGEGDAIKYTFEDAFGEKHEDVAASELKASSSGYSKEQINDLINKTPQLFTDENGEKKLSIDDFDKATGKLKEGIKLYENVEKYENIGGQRAYDLNELSSLESNGVYGQKVKDIKQAINNFEANAEGANGIANSQELAKWRITVNETTGEVKAFKLDDNGENAKEYTMYQEQKAGWNTTTINAKEAGFDENGVSNVPLGNGKTAYLSKGQELDTTAYQAAEAEYKNKKAEYDHAQEEANQKVKKLQQIDKQLELKLKRLDTERNALNTEIDAVKKVIQDNTDKSFKTFSG